MKPEQSIQKELERIDGIDQIDPVQHETRTPENPGFEQVNQGEVDFHTKAVEKVATVHPETGEFKDEVYTYLLNNGSQLQITVKHRFQCPTCDFTLDDPELPNKPHRCSHHTDNGECGRWTCIQCGGHCTSCDTPLCPEHSTGHATKDETYCFECVGDVEEQLRHQREMERRKQDRQEMQEERQMRQQRWNEKKQKAELEMKAAKIRRELKNQENQQNGNPFQQAQNQVQQSRDDFEQQLRKGRKQFQELINQ